MPNRPSRKLSGKGKRGPRRDVAAPNRGAVEAAATATDDALPLHADRPPLRLDEGGAVRIGKSRIAIDLVVQEYENGMTPEDMVRAYDTLELASVYAAIAYYLQHRAEVKAYLARREEEAARLRTLIEGHRPPCPSKKELLARRREKDHAEAGQ